MNRDNKRPKLPEGLLDNLHIKILALLLAVVVWILINSVNDPIRYMTITNVQVKLLNTSMITDQGNVYTVLDDTDVVPVVTVKAARSVIEDLDKDDIYATADIEDMTSLNTVEIKYYSSKYDSQIEDIDGSIENVLLSIEEKRTRSFVLEVTTTGEVADGYELDGITLEQNQVRVSGPYSLVSSIASAGASVDISGATSGISTYADIKLYDEEGNAIDTSDLTLNITTVKVTVTVLPQKTVPIEVEISGTPAEGYLTNGVVTLDPDTITLSGRSSVLSGIDSVVISGDSVNIEGYTSSLQTTVNIEDFLPEGVTLADTDASATINITIGIEAAETSSVSISADSISLDNIPDGYKARIRAVDDGEVTVAVDEGDTVSIWLTGLSSSLDAVQISTLEPVVDVGELLTELEEDDYAGFYTAIVNVTLPSGLSMTNTLTASVEVVRIEDAFSSEESASSDSSDSEEEETSEEISEDSSGDSDAQS